jgi:hypothetical protein
MKLQHSLKKKTEKNIGNNEKKNNTGKKETDSRQTQIGPFCVGMFRLVSRFTPFSGSLLLWFSQFLSFFPFLLEFSYVVEK